MTALPAASWTVRIAGLVAFVLGLFIWVAPDASVGIRPLHMLAGILLVAGLWALAAIAVRSGPPALAVVAFAWGLVLPILGLAQASLVVGGSHVVVQVAHLLAGIVAIGLGEALAARTATAGRAAA
jgi:hypothetical protein